MKRLRVLLPLVAVLAWVVSAVLVDASSETTVEMDYCQWSTNQRTTVPANSNVTVEWFMGAARKSQLQHFLNVVHATASINGKRVSHPDRYWSPPQKPYSQCFVSWQYPLGNLGAGQFAKVILQVTLSEPVHIGDIILQGSFLPPDKCKITAN